MQVTNEMVKIILDEIIKINYHKSFDAVDSYPWPHVVMSKEQWINSVYNGLEILLKDIPDGE